MSATAILQKDLAHENKTKTFKIRTMGKRTISLLAGKIRYILVAVPKGAINEASGNRDMLHNFACRVFV